MPLREIAPKLSPDQYEKNFSDIDPALSPRQAAIEATRCLYCFDAPCTAACPTHIDVPAFIKKVSTNNLAGSARVILSANILGHSCGRVCPTEVLCEGACVMLEKGEEAIEIGRLQRYSVDYALDHDLHLFKPLPKNGKRVACVGAGPASLACAAELAKWGYDVTIFDRKENPGGLNTYGIAAYKLRAADAIRETNLVKQLGVKFRQNTEVGRDIAFAQLEQQFDAIFVGVGLGETWELTLPGEELQGVSGAIEFIEQTKVQPFHKVDVGRRVACIGAGNTAIDVVTAARRLGAEAIYLIYRRGESEMPAFPYEYQLAKLDGIIFLWQTQPVRVLGSHGVVTGLECVRTELGPPDAKGRRTPVNVPGTEFTIAVDMVVRAVGQQPVTEFLRGVKGLDLNKNGTVKIGESHQTGNPKYFAAGDCTNGGKEVVDAVAEGMAAARGLDAWLGAPRAEPVQ
ncbi:MAG TPA: NAD(P)-dependent oxidoreductase [Candidatus Acidoferrales bacterium]|jgi:glutamate synthase (NADPH/NADH) small chain|nr:NAD(P)-dependent oxidoreductase [Candidatus Acidoferrales bacterium]